MPYLVGNLRSTLCLVTAELILKLLAFSEPFSPIICKEAWRGPCRRSEIWAEGTQNSTLAPQITKYILLESFRRHRRWADLKQDCPKMCPEDILIKVSWLGNCLELHQESQYFLGTLMVLMIIIPPRIIKLHWHFDGHNDDHDEEGNLNKDYLVSHQGNSCLKED